MTKFGESEIYCKPACKSATMHQESIHVRHFPENRQPTGIFQYSKLGEKNVEFLQQSRRTPNALGKFSCLSTLKIQIQDLISTTIRIAEVSAIVYKEKQDYPFEELISETGGSLGVFLGLSL